MINKLIVNADDFGMCEGNTIGILLAHKNGIVTSTTVMMNMPYALFGLEQAKKFPNLGIGVHLNITLGKSFTHPKSITDENGYFIRPKDYPDHKPHANLNELYIEWKAQIDEYIKITGHKPTHIDSHHHVHLLPWHIEVSQKLAKEYDIPMRQIKEGIFPYVQCIDTMEKENVRIDYIKEIFYRCNNTIEMMCHPALIDQKLYDISSYALPRMKELEILTSKEIKQFIKENNIELINYKNVY